MPSISWSRNAALAVIAFVAILAATLAFVAFVPPVPRMPTQEAARTVLQTFLPAQAALAAITLAVMVFMLQTLHGRADLNDRMYREYLQRSRVCGIFYGSIAALLSTGLAYLILQPSGGQTPFIELRGLQYLLFVGAAGLVANAALSTFLFHRTLYLLQPRILRDMKESLIRQDVESALDIHLARFLRLSKKDAPTIEDVLTPDPGEGSADAAIQLLFEEALRAANDRRLTDYQSLFDLLKSLLTRSMDQIQDQGVGFAAPGAAADWPPLGELRRRMLELREEILPRGWGEYAQELSSMDYWLITRGASRGAGEVFTLGLRGLQDNYVVANQTGDPELRRLVRDRVWSLINQSWYHLKDRADSEVDEDSSFPFVRFLAHELERHLDAALRYRHVEDFTQFALGFEDLLYQMSLSWGSNQYPPNIVRVSGLAELRRLHRVVMMGIGGRVIRLAQQGNLEEAAPYLDVARQTCASVDELAEDLAWVLDEFREDQFIWTDWESEGARPLKTYSVDPSRYPLTFFTLRALELIAYQKTDLSMGGHARKVKEWVVSNADGLEEFVLKEAAEAPGSPGDRLSRKALLVISLEDAEKADERADQDDVISRPLDDERLSEFVAGTYAARVESASLERLFSGVGRAMFVPEPVTLEATPRQRGWSTLLEKAPLTAKPGWAAYRPSDFGFEIERDLLGRLARELEQSPEVEGNLGGSSASELVAGIDVAMDELATEQGLLILLVGDWFDALVALDTEGHDGYVPGWRLEEKTNSARGEYRTNPILHLVEGERRVYVLDLATWGCLLRAPVDGKEAEIRIEEVTLERARELLTQNPKHFSKEPDEESKLRRLQGSVSFDVYFREDFWVQDRERARVIRP